MQQHDPSPTDTTMNPLTLYETMSEISARMVDAARANDWDRLVALEQDVAHLRDTLALEDRRPALSAEQRERKVRLIRRILADDAEVRRHTEPWMDSVRKMLGRGARERSVRQAYRA